MSVVMSVYKEPLNWIQESIDSILQQTFTDFEFVIINDNPGREELNGFLEANRVIDNRIIIITNEKNIGLTNSLNKGFARAQGDYIARMDADDIAMPTRFEKQVNLLDLKSDVGVCGSHIHYFGTSDFICEYPETDGDMYWFLKSNLAHPAVMIRKSVLNGIYYNSQFVVSQDYALWVRLYEEGVVMYNIQEVLLCYRKSVEQISSKSNSVQKKLSIGLRVRAFNHYCKENNIDIKIKEDGITQSLISDIIEKVHLPSNIKSELVVDLILSVRCSLSSFIVLLLKFCNKVSFYQLSRLIYYRLKRYDLQMF